MKLIRTTRRQTLTMGLAVFGLAASASGMIASPHLSAQSPSQTAVESHVFRLPPVDSDVRQVVVTAMAVDPRGEFLAAAGDDHVIRILKSDTMQIVHVLGDGIRKKDSKPGHFDWIRTLDFDDTGAKLSSSGNDGQLILWNRRREFEVMQEINSAPALACVRFSPSGKQIAAVGFDSQVFLIGGSSTKQPTLRCDCIDLRCCVYRDDGTTLAVAGRDGHLHLFDPIGGQLQHEQHVHQGRVRDMAFMPDSNVLVSVSEDGEVVRYDTGKREVLSRRKITSGRLFAVAIVDSRTIAAAGSDDGIHLVQVHDDGRELRTAGTLLGHVGSISTLVKSNGLLVSGGFDATIRRWDLTSLPATQDKIALKDESGKELNSKSFEATSR